MNVSPERVINIMITDDHSLFREGVKNALAKKKDINIIGEAVHGQDLLGKLEILQPDIVLLNINMPVLNGMDTLPLLVKNFPAVKVIILSFVGDRGIIRYMMEQGARTYLTKEVGGEEIYEAILACDKNDYYFNKTVIDALLNKKKEYGPDLNYTWSNKDRNILKLLQKGKTVSEIGKEVSLMERTVAAIIDKLNMKSNTRSPEELIEFAVKNNIID